MMTVSFPYSAICLHLFNYVSTTFMVVCKSLNELESSLILYWVKQRLEPTTLTYVNVVGAKMRSIIEVDQIIWMHLFNIRTMSMLLLKVVSRVVF